MISKVSDKLIKPLVKTKEYLQIKSLFETKKVADMVYSVDTSQLL